MKLKRLITILLAVLMVASIIAACQPTEEPTQPDPPAEDTTPADDDTDDTDDNGDDDVLPPDDGDDEDDTPAPTGDFGREPFVMPDMVTDLPRNETLFFNGMQWAAINGWSPLMTGANNWVHDGAGHGARTTVFETLYMYNALDGSFIPLIADGDYDFDLSTGELIVRIKEAAYWSDGTKITAHDVARTWEVSVNYTPGGNAQWLPFIESVTAIDAETVLIQAVMVDGVPANFRQVLTYLSTVYVLQADWLNTLVERNDGDPSQVVADPGEDFVWSGPYTRFFDDETRTILVRDDGYWGQHPSMWGSLPVPRFLAHTIFADNAAGDVAFMAGEVDVSQQFIANVHTLWEVQGLPISTFMDEPPFGLTASLPTVYFNLRVPELQNIAVRRAIAWAVDFDAIIENAMTGQSPTFSEVPRSIMNPTSVEQAMFHSDAVAHLQFEGNEIDRANEYLDAAGIYVNPATGIRELDGVPLRFVAACPQGWSDWEATIEIVAAAGESIGIEITTFFPDADTFLSSVTSEAGADFDIFMMWSNGISPTEPWGRARQLMSSEFVGMPGNWNGNWGAFENARADELIAAIPLELDHDAVVDMYTELVEIYLTYIPSFTAMYRPAMFFAVNESVWTGFTEAGDGRNVPPMCAVNGYAIRDLFEIRLVNP